MKSFPLSWKVWVLRLLWTVVLAAAVFLTPLAWQKLDAWVQNQRDAVWARLETVLGQKAVYQRIAPTVLSLLDFQEVRLLADDGTTVFQAASVRLAWDWGLLFQGRVTEALRRIQVINGTLRLDAQRDRALLEHWQALLRPSGSGGGTAFGFQVEGFNLSARWTDGAQSLSLDRGFAVLSPQGHEWGLKFRGALAWNDRSLPGAASLSLQGEARADAAFQNLSLRAEASALRSTWADVEPLTLQVSVAPDRITLAKVADTRPFDVQAVWNGADRSWEVRGAAEAFRPSDLVRLKTGAPWAGLARGTLTGRFSYRQKGGFSWAGTAAWPAGALPSPLDRESLRLDGRVDSRPDGFQFSGVRVETPSLALQFQGSLGGPALLPDGDLNLERWTVPGKGTLRGRVNLERTGSLVSFQGEDWTWNTLGTSRPTGWVEKTPGGWAFSLRGPVDGTEGAFGADGTFDPKEPRVEGSVELIALPLSVLRPEVAAVAPGFDLPAELWALEATVRGHAEWGAGTGPAVSVTSFAFHDPLVPDRLGSGSASWRGRHLDLALNPSSWDAVRAGGTLAADVEDDGSVAWTLVGTLWAHPFDLGGRWVPQDRTLAFSGQPGVSAVIHQNDAGVWSAELSLAPLEVVPGWTVGFQGAASLDGDLWTVQADSLTAAGRYPWNQEPFTVRTKAKVDPRSFRLDDLEVRDSRGTWSGAAASSWSADFSTPWAGRISLAVPPTRETLALDWVGTRADQWHLSLKTAGIDIARAGLPGLEPLVGRVASSGTLDWTPSGLVWALQTALSEARWGDSPLGFRANLSGTLTQVAVRSLNLSVNPARVVDGSIDVDAGSRSWKAALGVGLRLGASDWESRWKLDGLWSPPGEPLRVQGTLAATSNVWAQKPVADWGLSGQWTPTGWSAGLDDGGLSVQGASSGAFVAVARAPFPVAGSVQGVLTGTRFEAQVQDFRADLALVKDLMSSPLIALDSGLAEGTFSLGGNPADPEINGSLVLRNVRARSSFVRLALGPVDVPVVLSGHRVTVDPVDIGPGPQTWLVSGGARLDHFLPEEYQFMVQTDALSVIPVSYQYTGISAIGGVTGQLLVKGSPVAVTLGGKLVLQDAVVTLKPTETDTGGASLGFNADLTLITGRKVEFLWPNETLPLLRAVTASGQTLVIKANDVASTWSVAGKLGLRTGEINYLNRTFVIKEGQLLLQEDQTGFDPRISVRAEWRLRETTGPVVISLRADGTLSGFSPRFDASPYKTPDELQQLVGTTLALPSDYTKATNLDTALSLASDVGTSFLLTPFEETVKKNFQLDLFTVKTEILKKGLLGRATSGNTPLDASDYLDNTRLFFGKYIGDDLFLQGTLVFRRDGDVATQVSPRMVVEPELQMEFQTPFFLLNWTLLPQHPETLFVTDNTVTFRWNWSY